MAPLPLFARTERNSVKMPPKENLSLHSASNAVNNSALLPPGHFISVSYMSLNKCNKCEININAMLVKYVRLQSYQ